jgi:DNA polymerase-3 subunit chi
LSTEAVNTEPTQVDFYLLSDASRQADVFACRLAMMAWERKQRIYVIAATESSIRQLDEQMWQQPDKRFLPHSTADDPNAGKAPVIIGTLSGLNSTDVVINLCPNAVPQPERFKRVLEIVPFADNERQASRVKYKIYRNLGLKPRTHEINR